MRAKGERLVSLSPPATRPAAGSAAPPEAFPGEPLGGWQGPRSALVRDGEAFGRLVGEIDRPLFVVEDEGRTAMANCGVASLGDIGSGDSLPLVAFAPAMRLSQLGDASFRAEHRVRLAYMTGSMANGIASVEVVEAAGRAGMLSSFGAAGLSVGEIERAIERLGGCSQAGAWERGAWERGAWASVRLQPDSQPERAGARGGGRRSVPAARGAAGRGVGVSGPDAAGGALPRPRHPSRSSGAGRRAEPDHRQGVAGRGGAKCFCPPPAKLLSQLVERGEITAGQAALAGESRWPRT